MVVKNTDNTSVYGLSMDFGPFAFMDNFDPSYTPNHDDHLQRYSYKNQPSVIWWNLVRLGEALGEMMGVGAEVDNPEYVKNGVKEGQVDDVVSRAEKLITQIGEEYKATFMSEYKRLMTARLGLRNFKESDFAELFSEVLDTMEKLELDFNHFFRRLSNLTLKDIATPEATLEKASLFFHHEGPPKTISVDEARKSIASWLEKWKARVIEDWTEDGDTVVKTEAGDQERVRLMKSVNPNFVPRGWILDEIIQRVEKGGEREVLGRVMHMALNPFLDEWDGQTFNGTAWKGDKDEEKRWTGDVPRLVRAMQCSCSS